MKKLVAITGADGSGKSTLIQKWVDDAKANSSRVIQEVSIWDPLSQESIRSRFPLSPNKIDDYLSVLDSRARTFFLVHAFQQALEMALQNPKSDVLFLNSYWMKYFACEVAHGGDEQWLLQLSELFPKPDQIIYLDLPVSLAVSRKEGLTGYETGFAKPEDRKAHFGPFQSKVHQTLHHWKEKGNWVSIDSTQSIETTFEKSKEILHDLLA